MLSFPLVLCARHFVVSTATFSLKVILGERLVAHTTIRGRLSMANRIVGPTKECRHVLWYFCLFSHTHTPKFALKFGNLFATECEPFGGCRDEDEGGLSAAVESVELLFLDSFERHRSQHSKSIPLEI